MTTPARIVILDAAGAVLGHAADEPRNGAPSWRVVCAEHGETRTVGYPATAVHSLLFHLSSRALHGETS